MWCFDSFQHEYSHTHTRPNGKSGANEAIRKCWMPTTNLLRCGFSPKFKSKMYITVVSNVSIRAVTNRNRSQCQARTKEWKMAKTPNAHGSASVWMHFTLYAHSVYTFQLLRLQCRARGSRAVWTDRYMRPVHLCMLFPYCLWLCVIYFLSFGNSLTFN